MEQKMILLNYYGKINSDKYNYSQQQFNQHSGLSGIHPAIQILPAYAKI